MWYCKDREEGKDEGEGEGRISSTILCHGSTPLSYIPNLMVHSDGSLHRLLKHLLTGEEPLCASTVLHGVRDQLLQVFKRGEMGVSHGSTGGDLQRLQKISGRHYQVQV